MAKLFAGARAIVAFAKALPDEIAAKPVILEAERRAQRIKVAAVDAVLRHRIIIIAAAVGHRPGATPAEAIGDDRDVEQSYHTAAVVIAPLPLHPALQLSQIRFAGAQVI